MLNVVNVVIACVLFNLCFPKYLQSVLFHDHITSCVMLHTASIISKNPVHKKLMVSLNC